MSLSACPISTAWGESGDLTATYKQYGTLTKQGEYEAAIPVAIKLIDLAESRYGENHEAVAFALGARAALYWRLEYYEAAEPLFVRSLLIREQLFGIGHPRLKTVYFQLAVIYDKQWRHREAQEKYELVLGMKEEYVDETDDQMLMISLFNLGAIYTLYERYTEAEELFKQSLKIPLPKTS